jgi:hypothetical protein
LLYCWQLFSILDDLVSKLSLLPRTILLLGEIFCYFITVIFLYDNISDDLSAGGFLSGCEV